ncbi:MAG: NYN domain-containing protein [Burkholderiales bacterium]
MKDQNRVIVFVDGFNLYHAIDELNRDIKTKQFTHSKHYLKWLNISALSNALIHPAQDRLVGAYYFSAFAGWIAQDAQDRHRDYVAALKSTGFVPVMGTFKKKPRKCPNCKHTWDGHEEKESDVNIALHLVTLAYENAFDKAIIFTADTDLAPAIRTVREKFPDKQVYVAIPERRLNRSKALENAANGRIRVTELHFARNLFPAQVVLPSGSVINRPSKYLPPN